jgi:hypothetical protein
VDVVDEMPDQETLWMEIARQIFKMAEYAMTADVSSVCRKTCAEFGALS